MFIAVSLAPRTIFGTNSEDLETRARLLMGKVICTHWKSSQIGVVRICLGKKWDLKREWFCNALLCVADWLYKCSVQKLVVIISNIESGEVLERWQFDIECDKTAKDDR